MEQEIETVAHALKRPAGDSELFATPATLLSNHAAFVRACHETWKKSHSTALEWLQFHEGFLLREKTHPLGPSVKNFGEYNLAVWRRVNDAIVWSLFGMRRDKVKRLCLYKRRNLLAESNPRTALAMLEELNADPMAIAIWNDATSCVDIGDMLYIKNGLKPFPEFLELKEGAVNRAIVEFLETNEESRDAASRAFEDRFGPKGAKQLDRVLRQKKTGEQAISLLVNEKGVDPVTGYEIQVTETVNQPESYDGQLHELLDRAGNTEEGILDCVDSCLWLFAASGGRRKSLHAAKRFMELLEQRVADFSPPPGRKTQLGTATKS